MLTIFKYPIPIEDAFTLDMHQGSEILSFQTQQGGLVMWVLVDTRHENEKREFRLIGTGHPIEDAGDDLTFVGTCQMNDGGLVWHLFEFNPL